MNVNKKCMDLCVSEILSYVKEKNNAGRRDVKGKDCEPKADVKNEEKDDARHSPPLRPLPDCPFHTGPQGKGQGIGTNRD